MADLVDGLRQITADEFNGGRGTVIGPRVDSLGKSGSVPAFAPALDEGALEGHGVENDERHQ
jgi:hypothetical protein